MGIIDNGGKEFLRAYLRGHSGLSRQSATAICGRTLAMGNDLEAILDGTIASASGESIEIGSDGMANATFLRRCGQFGCNGMIAATVDSSEKILGIDCVEPDVCRPQ